MEAALKAAVEHEGSRWDEVASDAGFTFLWETESAVSTARSARAATPPGLPYVSNSLILKDLDALKRVHDDIFELQTNLSGRSLPTTAEHSGRLSLPGGPASYVASPADTPVAASAARADAERPRVDASPLIEPMRGIALSDRDSRWEKRRQERGLGSPAASSRPEEPDADPRRRSIVREAHHVMLGRAGSEVISSSSSKPGGATGRYNVITGQFDK
jgi:hypothetical protein